MLRRLLISVVLVFGISTVKALAQNTNSAPAGRPRTAAPTTNTNRSAADSQKNTDVHQPATTQTEARRTTPKPKVTATTPASSQSVAEVFNALLNGSKGREVGRSRCFDHDARSRWRGCHLSLDPIANLQGHA